MKPDRVISTIRIPVQAKTRGILLRKPSHARVIVPRTEVIRPALYIKVFAAIPKRVGVGADAILLVAEGVVGVWFVAFSTPPGRLRRAVLLLSVNRRLPYSARAIRRPRIPHSWKTFAW